jgi:thiol:disulfide interchange protein DsbA
MRLTTLFLRTLTALGLALSFIAAAPAAQITLGKDYVEVRPPQPTDSGGKIEVLEFFW